MHEVDDIHNGSIIDPEDDRPISLRRKRRGSIGSNHQRDANIKNKATSTQTSGMATPPATPHRSKKRVRFSEPGPSSSTGLTPFFCRNTVSSPPPSRTRRQSTPSNRWNLAVDDTPVISGTLQFVPFRQVLSGKVKRRLTRRGLNEEYDKIKDEERNEKKFRNAEIERLNEELRLLKEEQEVASQIGVEAGVQLVDNPHSIARIQDLQHQIALLKAELQRYQGDVDAQDNPDWMRGARDAPNRDDAFMPNYDDDFNTEMTDAFLSTPGRGTFPSPPTTMPNTPSISGRHVDLTNEVPIADPEKQRLESQLTALHEEFDTLSKNLELTNNTHERLSVKLLPFLSESSQSEDSGNLDAALDAVLTQLAVSQSTAHDSVTRFSALTTEIRRLFPSSSTSPSAPDSILQMLHTQFRAARLELEYLTPGENSEGFDNTKLLDMLVSRLKVLTRQVTEQEVDIDQYHSQEISLRQQLGSRIDATDLLQNSLAKANSEIETLESDLQERDESISKLTQALQGYRNEVSGLETLITRLEVDHAADLGILRDEIQNTKKDSESKLLDSQLQLDTLKAASEGREMLMFQLEQRLSAALASSQTLQDKITALQQEHSSATARMQESAVERERAHGDALALRDARVAELRDEIERVNASLKEAHTTIQDLKLERGQLKWESAQLAARVEGERRRGSIIAQSIVGQSVLISETAQGYLNEDVAVRSSRQSNDNSSDAGSSPAVVVVASSQSGVKPGRYLEGGLARKQSKKRRRYDSGMGFLEEEDEVLEKDS